jgi:hypothetical protein
MKFEIQFSYSIKVRTSHKQFMVFVWPRLSVDTEKITALQLLRRYARAITQRWA